MLQPLRIPSSFPTGLTPAVVEQGRVVFFVQRVEGEECEGEDDGDEGLEEVGWWGGVWVRVGGRGGAGRRGERGDAGGSGGVWCMRVGTGESYGGKGSDGLV